MHGTRSRYRPFTDPGAQILLSLFLWFPAPRLLCLDTSLLFLVSPSRLISIL